jgi:protein-tyrosine phosphatase
MPRTISPIDATSPRDIDGPELPASPGRGQSSDSTFAIRRILVVCLGNICRSPMAEYVLRKHLQGRGVTVESAGIAATNGARIDPLALGVLAAHGIDADGHVARRLEQAMLDAADLVLVMERAHLDFIRARFPSATGKTFLLGRWLGEFEMPDPLGRPRETFEHLYRAVERAAHRWCELI